MDIVVKRSQKVMFFGVPDKEGGSVTYHRMTGFTDMSKSANPKEYTRQYIDEEFERSDVIGYAPSYSYGFDEFVGNAVHEDMVTISDEEKTGTDAVRELVLVDLTQGDADSGYYAIRRKFSVIPDSEGDSTDAYTHSGTLKSNGEREIGKATSEDDWQTCVFVTA